MECILVQGGPFFSEGLLFFSTYLRFDHFTPILARRLLDDWAGFMNGWMIPRLFLVLELDRIGIEIELFTLHTYL